MTKQLQSVEKSCGFFKWTMCGMMVLEWYRSEQAIVAVLLGKGWMGVCRVDVSECKISVRMTGFGILGGRKVMIAI
jgi:hypothetical protein